MTIDELLALRIHNHRLVNSNLEAPRDAVVWFGAIQAQELLSSLFAIGLRIPGSTEQRIEAALADRSIARGWPMRSTLHYLPAEDALWITRLLGPRQNKKGASIYRNYALTTPIFNKARPILEKALADGPRIREEIYAALEARGIDVSEGRGMHILKFWGQEGVLCVGPRQGKQQTMALLETWTSKNVTPADDDEAFAILARRYYQSHGPATLRDFAWWTGATLAECKKATEAIKADLTRETIDGCDYFYASAAMVPRLNASQALLLPAFDEYTVAYVDRSIVMQTADLKAAGNGLNPNIVMGGRVIGTWKRTIAGRKALVQLQPFASLTRQHQKAISAAVSAFGEYTGMPTEIKILRSESTS